MTNLEQRRRQLREKKTARRIARRRRRAANAAAAAAPDDFDFNDDNHPAAFDESAPADECYNCAQCGRRFSGAPFSTIILGGMFDAHSDGEYSPPNYLCSQRCRNKFLPDHFPINPPTH